MFAVLDILLLALFFVILVGVAMVIVQSCTKKKLVHAKSHAPASTGMTCGGGAEAHTCGAIDPVSDPPYNIKQIIKQSILLEEHLTQENKRCKDCIFKHLLHISALAEEAAMLAGENVGKYPYMSDSVIFYNEQLEAWLKNPSSVEVQIHIATQLRDWRKKLAAKYFLSKTA
jgi:hypothetical protein